jgi:V/A-type H+-transporting ATPase subunit K
LPKRQKNKEEKFMDLGQLGASVVFGLAAIGSGLGIGIAGMATVGAWKKCYLANKAAPMLLLAFTGNPLTQTFYGFILMGQVKAAALANPQYAMMYLGYGVAAGLSLLFSAIVQGKIAACACDALVEKNKGFAQYYIVMGIAESVALFTMVLTMTSL